MNTDITDLYHRYIKQESDIKSEEYTRGDYYDGWFRASSAGQCFKKQAYKLRKAKAEPIKPQVARNFRLGTILHEDIEKALIGSEYYTEYEVEIPDFRVVGHIDICTIDDNGNGTVTDIKTVHSFKWKKMFGQKKNRDRNPSKNYETQVGTYAVGLSDKHNLNHVDMSILWYKKDDASIKIQTVHQKYIAVALEYWANLAEVIDEIKYSEVDILVAGAEPNVPVYEWECRYCEFSNICDTPFKET